MTRTRLILVCAVLLGQLAEAVCGATLTARAEQDLRAARAAASKALPCVIIAGSDEVDAGIDQPGIDQPGIDQPGVERPGVERRQGERPIFGPPTAAEVEADEKSSSRQMDGDQDERRNGMAVPAQIPATMERTVRVPATTHVPAPFDAWIATVDHQGRLRFTCRHRPATTTGRALAFFTLASPIRYHAPPRFQPA